VIEQLPTKEVELVRRYFDADAKHAMYDFAVVTIDKDESYLVVLNIVHDKAAVVMRDPERESTMGDVGGHGFFSKNALGSWERDDRPEFEMEGGVWTLTRYLEVLSKCESGPVKRFEWKMKGAPPQF
jgi:hypothetical protein